MPCPWLSLTAVHRQPSLTLPSGWTPTRRYLCIVSLHQAGNFWGKPRIYEIFRWNFLIFSYFCLCIVLVNILLIWSPVSFIKPHKVMGSLLISASLFYAQMKAKEISVSSPCTRTNKNHWVWSHPEFCPWEIPCFISSSFLSQKHHISSFAVVSNLGRVRTSLTDHSHFKRNLAAFSVELNLF